MLELDEALASFAIQRSAALGNAIETLGREAVGGFTAPVFKKNLEFHRAWMKLALESATRTWCLDTLIDKLPKLLDGKEHGSGDKCEALVERLDVLAKLEPDPRVARGVLAMLELRAPVAGFTIVLEAASKAILRHADDATAASPALDELGDELDRDKLPKPVVLDASARARAAAVKRPAKRDTAALFAAVYASPDADEPREVLADALQEAGDPRGEFIALQLREARGDTSAELRDRAQTLVKEHGKAWLGPLRPLTYRAEMRRGFLQRLELAGSWSTNKWAELAREPMLATVEELVPAQATGVVYAKFLAGPIARTVRAITVFDDAVWKVVTTTAMPRLREVVATGWTRKDYKERFTTQTLPWLETHPQITRLACGLDRLPTMSKALVARLTDLAVDCAIPSGVKLWLKLRTLHTLTMGLLYDPIVLIRDGKREFARLLSTRFGTPVPKLRLLPKTIERIEVVNNATQAKELAKSFPKLEIVAVRAPSGTITGVK